MGVDFEARKKKLAKDLLYLFNKLNVWQLNMAELIGCYDDCFYTPLEAQMYGCSNMAELMRCKFINQILEVKFVSSQFWDVCKLFLLYRLIQTVYVCSPMVED